VEIRWLEDSPNIQATRYKTTSKKRPLYGSHLIALAALVLVLPLDVFAAGFDGEDPLLVVVDEVAAVRSSYTPHLS
jgi:hypothetical protein